MTTISPVEFEKKNIDDGFLALCMLLDRRDISGPLVISPSLSAGKLRRYVTEYCSQPLLNINLWPTWPNQRGCLSLALSYHNFSSPAVLIRLCWFCTSLWSFPENPRHYFSHPSVACFITSRCFSLDAGCLFVMFHMIKIASVVDRCLCDERCDWLKRDRGCGL